MNVECENVSKKHKEQRHFGVLQSGTVWTKYVQDYILFKYMVYWAPSSVKLWSVRFQHWQLSKRTRLLKSISVNRDLKNKSAMQLLAIKRL